jgi:hypothetical protein
LKPSDRTFKEGHVQGLGYCGSVLDTVHMQLGGKLLVTSLRIQIVSQKFPDSCNVTICLVYCSAT